MTMEVSEVSTATQVTDDDVRNSLYEIYRSITSPVDHDNDALLEKIRFQLISLGYDTDTWPEPEKSPKP